MDHDLVMICTGRVRLAAAGEKTPCHFHKGIDLVIEKHIAFVCGRQCRRRCSNCLQHQFASLPDQLNADGHGAVVKALALEYAKRPWAKAAEHPCS
ncbi:MAG: hypothetical protein O2971_20245 [Proteobacteria bacterium]|nr:hypothetical protein [Pseudomonadota bacterium]